MLRPLSALCLALIFPGCASLQGDKSAAALHPGASGEIKYLSMDLAHAAVFSAGAARFGPADLTLSGGAWPSSPATYVAPAEDIQCLSVGPAGSDVQYAVKRPITRGDEYRCMGTGFRVVKCFESCRAAVIERRVPLRGSGPPGTLTSYMYVDGCLGVIAFSQEDDFSSGAPLDAEWLRGDVGILAARDYPSCSPL